MSAGRGLALGLLGLTLGQAVLSSEQTTRNNVVGSAFVLASRIFARVVDPTLPLIPDTRHKTGPNKPAAYITGSPPATSPTPPATARPPASGQTIINA